MAKMEWDAKRIAALARMFGAGASDWDIADAFGVTAGAVSKKRRELGLFRGERPQKKDGSRYEKDITPARNSRPQQTCPLTLRRGEPEAAEAIRLMLTVRGDAGREVAMWHVMEARGLA